MKWYVGGLKLHLVGARVYHLVLGTVSEELVSLTFFTDFVFWGEPSFTENVDAIESLNYTLVKD